MMPGNAKKARRWRVTGWIGNCGQVAKYELECKVSKRVAIAYSSGGWGIWSMGAVAYASGEERSRSAAFKAARCCLDAMAEKASRGYFPEQINRRLKEVLN
jgi:hypothetical protein